MHVLARGPGWWLGGGGQARPCEQPHRWGGSWTYRRVGIRAASHRHWQVCKTWGWPPLCNPTPPLLPPRHSHTLLSPSLSLLILSFFFFNYIQNSPTHLFNIYASNFFFYPTSNSFLQGLHTCKNFNPEVLAPTYKPSKYAWCVHLKTCHFHMAIQQRVDKW